MLGEMLVRITWIEVNALACGGIPVSMENLESLKSQGIQAIITLTEHPLSSQSALKQALADMGFTVYHAPIVDQDPPTNQQVEEVFAFFNQMKAEHKPVYVHCHAGIGRTGTMIHALSLREGMELGAAKEKIKRIRPARQFFMLSSTQQAFLETLAKQLRP